MRTNHLRKGHSRLLYLAGICITPLAMSVAVAAESTDEVSSAAPALDTVVVTGTREGGKKSSESLSPIDVISGEQLKSTGQTDLRDALVKAVPSITRQSMGYSTSVLTNTLSLHGLSSNHVLVLVNGKRRHESANINVWGGLQMGSTGVDIDMIPVSAIDHVEVLRDGASAQYGSDAIAGVINIILKNKDSGGSVSETVGQYNDGDGLTDSGSANAGFAIGDNGFLNLSGEYKEQDHTVRSGIDNRTGKRDNLLIGNPAVHRQDISFNSGYALENGVDFYSFGTYAQRSTRANAHYRLPNILPTVYPAGFTPQVIGDDKDYSLTLGAKGDEPIAGWQWDLSSTYGENTLDTETGHSGNVQLFADTGYTPKTFDTGTFKNKQWTNNLDLKRAFDLPVLPSALNVAVGAEHRREWYEVQAGESASHYGGGSIGASGQAPLSEGSWSRDVLGSYLDLSTKLTQKWQVDAAGRYEHYDDFGSTTNGKLSTRYEFSPEIAVRASVSSGFRAPSLAQQNFTSLIVMPTSASGLVAVNSVAGKLLGAQSLKPEKSTNFGLGVVLSPVKNLNIAIDAYQIEIRDRIVGGATSSGSTAANALLAGGIALPAGLTSINAQYLTNGADTRTRGVDITAGYKTSLDRAGVIDWDLSANFNRTKLLENKIGPNGRPLLNDQQESFLTSTTPKSRVTVGGTWSYDRLAVSLHETRYGSTSTEQTFYSGPNNSSTTVFNHFVNDPKYLTDIEGRYAVSKNLQISLGANNLFNVKPDKLPAESTYLGVMRYDVYATQIGLNGAFYYLRAGYSF